MKLTPLGKMLRIIRINASENLITMATKLGVSASFLSSVETSKRAAPKGWSNKIIELYSLDEETSAEVKRLITNTIKQIRFDVTNSRWAVKELLLGLTYKHDTLTDEQIKQIKQIVE